jgi:branched-chain amino acid transport system ATP-binding protein
MLEVNDLHVNIESVQVLRGFSLRLETKAMSGLVGRNGAGKTSFMRSLMGHLYPSSGSMLFHGEDLTKLPPEARATLGIGYMPEDRGLVPELTVEENILIPLWVSPNLKAQERLRFVYSVLPEVEAMSSRKALLLSGGQQKLVALARALSIGTKLLLLDEPFEGVAPALSIRLSEVISGLRGTDLSVLIAQSDLNHSSNLVSQEVVIERGANAV